MNFEQRDSLANTILANYVQVATYLISKSRKGGGNMFRHQWYTLGVCLDYGYSDPVLLKASVVHDVIEDVENFDHTIISDIDSDGQAVLKVVLEVSRQKTETKEQYLDRLKTASFNAKIVKCADRISNLVDVNIYTFGLEKTERLIEQTIKYVYPLAEEVNIEMYKELQDLIALRQDLVCFYKTRLCQREKKICSLK